MRLIQKLIVCIVMLMPLFGICGSSHCAGLVGKDERFLCTAVGLNNMTVCNEISTQDGVNHCKAMTAGSSGFCEKVNLGNRPFCLMGVRNQQRKSMWGVS